MGKLTVQRRYLPICRQFTIQISHRDLARMSILLIPFKAFDGASLGGITLIPCKTSMHLDKYEYCISPLLHFRTTPTHARLQPSTQRLMQSTILHDHQVKPHRMKDSTHNPVTRKQIKGPLMLVATVTAVDLLQLPALSVTRQQGE